MALTPSSAFSPPIFSGSAGLPAAYARPFSGAPSPARPGTSATATDANGAAFVSISPEAERLNVLGARPPGASPAAPPGAEAESESQAPPLLGAGETEEESAPGEAAETAEEESEESRTNALGPAELTEEEQREVEKLEARDAEVRVHERAHQSAGGRYAGAARFSYTMGPDAKRYATGGEVPIDVAAIPNNPEATITKMQVVKRAALAPAEPSAADRSIYSQAVQRELRAHSEIRQENAPGLSESEDTSARSEEDDGLSSVEDGQSPVANSEKPEAFGAAADLPKRSLIEPYAAGQKSAAASSTGFLGVA